LVKVGVSRSTLAVVLYLGLRVVVTHNARINHKAGGGVKEITHVKHGIHITPRILLMMLKYVRYSGESLMEVG